MTIVYILIAILIFGVLIIIHELGHFAAAKACGVRVEEFAVGMAPPYSKAEGRDDLFAALHPIRRLLRHDRRGRGVERPARVTNQAAWKRVIILAPVRL